MSKRKIVRTGATPIDKYGRGSAAANGVGFVDLAPGDTFDGLEAQLRARISEVYVNQTLGISASIGSKRNANELAKHMAPGEGEEVHKFAAKNVGRLFERGTIGIRHLDKKAFSGQRWPLRFIRVFSPFVFAGKRFLATITLKENAQGGNLYSVEAVGITKDACSERTPRGAMSEDLNAAPFLEHAPLLNEIISYYVGDINWTRPEFIGSSEAFTILAAVTRLQAMLESSRQNVPNLCPAVQCTGCAACHDACAKGAISMVPDGEGFAHPQIDAAKCIRCGRCEQLCPVLHPDAPSEPLAVYAAKAKDDELRLQSSSGGIFSLLARQVIKQGGIVFGAGWDKSDWHVVHKTAENELELDELRGSKYVQSDTRGIYTNVKSQLATGRQVLFSGTPCQIAALRRFLGREYDNLVLADVICHAVPSPLVWRRYLETRIEAANMTGSADGQAIRRISFRRKDCGWKRFSLSLTFTNDREYRQTLDKDPFLQAFLNEFCNRPSCQTCPFKSGVSGADLTLGDYWGIAKAHRGMDDDKGASVLLVNTQKGEDLFNGILRDVSSIPSKCKYLRRLNLAFAKPIALTARKKAQRTEFFVRLDEEDLDSLIARLKHRPLCCRGLSLARRCAFWLPNRIVERIVYR